MNTVTLLDGRTYNVSDISFNPDNYSFTLVTGEDITKLIPIAGKKLFAGFDPLKYDDIVYAQNYYATHGQWPPAIGSTSTWANFVSQIETDPLKAPIEAVNKGISEITSSSGFVTLAVIFVVLVVGIVLIKK